MSLSERLKEIDRRRPNRGCETCIWLKTLTESDRESISDWLTNGWSLRQLHHICATDPINPLRVSLTAFKNHLKDCRDK